MKAKSSIGSRLDSLVRPLIVNLLQFIRQPTGGTWYLSTSQKWQCIGMLLLIEVLFTIVVVTPLSQLAMTWLQREQEPLADHETLGFALLMYVLIAPFFEEIMFRYWLKYPARRDNRTGSAWLPLVVYGSVAVFALVHISVLFPGSWWHWLLMPLMVLSQFSGGLIIAWLRLRFGFWYGMAYHSLWNFFVLVLLSIVLLWVQGTYSVTNKDYSFKLSEQPFYQSSRPKIFKADLRDSMVYRLEVKQYTLHKLLDTLYGQNRWRTSDAFINLKLEAPKGISKEQVLQLLQERHTIEPVVSGQAKKDGF